MVMCNDALHVHPAYHHCSDADSAPQPSCWMSPTRRPITHGGSVPKVIDPGTTCHFPWQDPSRNLAYVYINEGDVYDRADGSQYSYVTVIDTKSQKVSREPTVRNIAVRL